MLKRRCVEKEVTPKMNQLKDSDTSQKPSPALKYSNISSTEDPALEALPTDSKQVRAEKIVAWTKLRLKQDADQLP